MAAQGTAFETPRACPFVALELDRDKRADKPDYRHRCFAEPTPAPRSIAHQEAYCLSPNFAACPVFQDWAVRAAARPPEETGSSAAASGPQIVGAAAMAADDGEPDVDQSVADVESETAETSDSAGIAGAAIAGTAAAAGTAFDAATPAPPSGASVIEQLPEDVSTTAAGAEIAAAAAATTGMGPALASPPTFATTGWEDEAAQQQQLGVFDTDEGTAEPAMSSAQDRSDAAAAGATGLAAAGVAGAAAAATPDQPAVPAAEADAMIPPFLASRSARPLGSTLPSPAAQPRPTGPVSREEIVPSWEVDGRYGAEPPTEPTGSRFDTILTAIAVIAILAIGVAAVLFLPGMLSSKTPQTTPNPSFVFPSAGPSALPSAVSSVAPTAGASSGQSVPPTAAASVGPAASPHLYKIKPGDSLAKIASKFGVAVDDIMAANPSITNPDSIQVGQVIIIPPPAPASP